MKNSEHNDTKNTNDLEVKPVIRGKIFVIISLLVSAFYIFNMRLEVPKKTIFLDTFLKIKIKFLHVKLPLEYLELFLTFASALLVLIALYIILKQKLTKYRLTNLYLEKTHGVFFRESDSTDLVSITDQKLTRNPIDILLGMSKILVIAKDPTHPTMLLKHLSSKDANNIVNFLRQNAFKSYTEYRISKDNKLS